MIRKLLILSLGEFFTIIFKLKVEMLFTVGKVEKNYKI